VVSSIAEEAVGTSAVVLVEHVLVPAKAVGIAVTAEIAVVIALPRVVKVVEGVTADVEAHVAIETATVRASIAVVLVPRVVSVGVGVGIGVGVEA